MKFWYHIFLIKIRIFTLKNYIINYYNENEKKYLSSYFIIIYLDQYIIIILIPKDSNCIASLLIVIYKANKYNDNILAILEVQW